MDENPTRCVSVCLVCSELFTGRKLELDEIVMVRNGMNEGCDGWMGKYDNEGEKDEYNLKIDKNNMIK